MQARINGLRPEEGFSFLAPADGARPTLVHYLSHVEDWSTWAVADNDFPIMDAALAYLHAHAPEEVEPRVLWGDTGPRNMLFADDLSVAAVLDWENAMLGPPEVDLGWWIMMENFWSTAMGFERASGLFTPEETVARYEDQIGRRVEHIDYYETLAWTRFELVVIRNFSMVHADGRLGGPLSDVVRTIPIDRVLRERLARAGYDVPD
jgi:aminoglycoside phosphotransferase (APT) family kinase protein